MNIDNYVTTAANKWRKYGVFLVIEGMDGSGKSSAVQWTKDKLNSLGVQNITLRMPGGTTAGEKLRDILLHQGEIDKHTELLLMQACRTEAWYTIIQPALESGTWVICDRYTASSYAYQGAGKKVDDHFIASVIEQSTPSYKVDCNIYIHRHFGDIITTLHEKDKDRFESLDRETLALIYSKYENMSYSDSNRFNWHKIENHTTLDDYKHKIDQFVEQLVTRYDEIRKDIKNDTN